MRIFRRKQGNKEEHVDLTIGRVYFKPLTHGIIQKVKSQATIAGTLVNANLYLMLMEIALLDLPKKKYMRLSIEDGKKVSEAIQKILERHGLVRDKIEDEIEPIKGKQFTDNERKVFEGHKETVLSKLKRGAYNGR